MSQFDPYAQIETMHRCHEIDGADPYGAGCSRPARSAHSYIVCRNRMSESGARNRRNLVLGASSRAKAFSFIARSAST